MTAHERALRTTETRRHRGNTEKNETLLFGSVKSPCLRASVVFLLLIGWLATSQLSSVAFGQQPARQEFQLVSDGVEHLQITRGYKSVDEVTGPWLINLLRVDLSKVDIQVVHALDEAVGLETTSSMAMRYGAIAAINGGYFRTTGTYRGDSMGVLQLDSKLLSEPVDGRAAFGLIKRGNQTEIVFGHLRFNAMIKTSSGGELAVSGINRPRSADELIIYTPEFHRTTLTAPDGVEAIVRRGRTVDINDNRGSNAIPADGYVISAVGKAREWALKNLKRGARVELSASLVPVEAAQAGLWKRACCIVGGGPQLIKGGRVEISAGAEKIGEKFVTDRHPRTAIARLKTGKLLLITVDGRQSGVSVGMSLVELSQLLLEFETVEAINLDGGGSTAMVIKDKLVNKPSDAAGERPVSDAILIMPKTLKRPQPAH